MDEKLTNMQGGLGVGGLPRAPSRQAVLQPAAGDMMSVERRERSLKKLSCHCERQFSELLSEAVPLLAGRLLQSLRSFAMTDFFLIEVCEALWSYS
jgi:hypothetical protein